MLLLQVVLWVVIPRLLERGSTTVVMTVFLIMFLLQYLPKIYHSVCLLRRMQNLSGYIFGTVWWGIALNMIAYFVASHVSLTYSSSNSLSVCKRIYSYKFINSDKYMDDENIQAHKYIALHKAWRLKVEISYIITQYSIHSPPPPIFIAILISFILL